MDVIIDDGGRRAAGFRGMAGDCVTRSIAIASGLGYADVYAALSEGCRTQRVTKGRRRLASARDGVNTSRKWFKDYMRSIGFEWTATMKVGSGCRVHLTDGELPDGRLVVMLSRHATAVIDGVIHDMHDPQRDAHECRRFPGWETAELKPGETRNENGIHTIRRRAVYGYWRLQS